MSSIVSTDILFFVLPPSPPAEKATASKDESCNPAPTMEFEQSRPKQMGF
jgi:hypothetical protein